MSPIQGIVNEITLVDLEAALSEPLFDELMDEKNIVQLTREDSPHQTVYRLETKKKITMMVTVPKNGGETSIQD
jgi:hypothetical protein